MRARYQIWVLLLAACAGAPRPVRIAGPQPVDAVARALAAAGQPPDEVRPDRVTTKWIDTGVLYGRLGTEPASIVRRYVAVVGPSDLLLRVETQRCAQGSWDPARASVGACEELDGLVPAHRVDLARLGESLRRALQGR